MTKNWSRLIAVSIALILITTLASQVLTLSGSASSEPHVTWLPIITSSTATWKQLDKGGGQVGALSLAICQNNRDILYLGTVNGLYLWSTSNKWEQVHQREDPGTPVPGSVWDIWITEDCNTVYAAALEAGLWEVTQDEGVRIDTDQVPPTGSVIVRGNYLFAGTDGGIYRYAIDRKEWMPRDVGKLITEQSLTDGRIYAADWGYGVWYNDSCNSNQCEWKSIPAPAPLVYIRDVVGINPQSLSTRVLTATSAGIAFHTAGTWSRPTSAPQPPGNVFALEKSKSSGGYSVFAAVEGGGIWQSDDMGGVTWYQIGALKFLTRDLVVADNVLYAVTENDGVWQWPLANP